MEISIPSVEKIAGFQKIEYLGEPAAHRIRFSLHGSRCFAGVAADLLVTKGLLLKKGGIKHSITWNGIIDANIEAGTVTVESDLFPWDDGAEEAKHVLLAVRQLSQSGEYVPVSKIKEWWTVGGYPPKLDMGVRYALASGWLDLHAHHNSVRDTGLAPR